MSFKPFFVHRFQGPGKMSNRNPRGFTFYIQPDPSDTRAVLVSEAWCSPKDQFCKKTGRSQAMAATPNKINKRHLVHDLAVAEYTCGLSESFVNLNAWNYILRYLL